MRKAISVALLGGFLSSLGMAAIAQTTTTEPKSQADCKKASETYDPATRTCKDSKS
jgi:hypothetical protein